MTKHTGKLSTPCDICGKIFNRKDTVRNHKIRMHGVTQHEGNGERKFQCQQCDYQAKWKGNLDAHIGYKHTGCEISL